MTAVSITTKTSNELGILNVSDQHTLHPRTPTRLTLRSMSELFCRPKWLAREVDLALFSGDFYDGPGDLPDTNVLLTQAWISSWLIECRNANVILRVLEGTPSHDNGQSKMFEVLNEGIGANLRYITEISIEYIEQLGIHVLYIPDEQGTGDEVWAEVQRQLSLHGLEKVDYAVMHGLFDFHLPAHVVDPKAHLRYRYESIVRRWVFIGHHHTHRVEGRIITPGSVQRNKHGEEEDKGAVFVRDRLARDPQRGDVQFLRNKLAKEYRTFQTHDRTVREVAATIAAANLPTGSSIRLMGESFDPAMQAIKELQIEFPGHDWQKETTATRRAMETKIDDLQFTYTQIQLTKENIPTLLLERAAKRGQTPERLALAQRLLEEIL